MGSWIGGRFWFWGVLNEFQPLCKANCIYNSYNNGENDPFFHQVQEYLQKGCMYLVLFVKAKLGQMTSKGVLIPAVLMKSACIDTFPEHWAFYYPFWVKIHRMWSTWYGHSPHSDGFGVIVSSDPPESVELCTASRGQVTVLLDSPLKEVLGRVVGATLITASSWTIW